MTIIFQNALEEGDYSAYGPPYQSLGCTNQVQSATKFRGNYAQRVLTAGNAFDGGGAPIPAFVATDPCFLRSYVLVRQANIAVGENMAFSYLFGVDGNMTLGAGIHNYGGTLYFCTNSFEGGFFPQDTQGISKLVLNRWYCLEIKRWVAGVTQQLWVNGALEVTANRAITVNTVGGNLALGYQSAVGINEIYQDNLVVSDQYIGPLFDQGRMMKNMGL